LSASRPIPPARTFSTRSCWRSGARKPELAAASVYDPNFVSYVGDFTSWDLQWHLWTRGVRFDVQLETRPTNRRVFNARRSYRPSTFEDFCSVIVSCREMYCVTSGTATLAAALGKPVTAFYGSGQKPFFHHSRLHRYTRIEPFQPAAALRGLIARASA
jgi:hypothetical protein